MTIYSVNAIVYNMVKGRNTIVVGTRISDLMYDAIGLIAGKKNMTISECIRKILDEDLEVQVYMFELKEMRSILLEHLVESLKDD